jgi:hypothetical protein
MEALAVRVNHKMAEIAKANAKCKGRVNPDNPKERAGNRRPKERVDSDGLDDWAGNVRPETRSTKMPTKSRHGFSIETINKNVSSGDDFSLASRDEVASDGMDNKLNDKVAGAALGTGLTGAVAGGRRLCRCCLLAEPPGRTGICRRCCRFLPGSATSADSSALARRPTGGSQH